MVERSSSKLWALCLAIGALVTATAVATTWQALSGERLAFLSVRIAPLRTQTGKVFSAFAPGQLFHVPEGADGLDRIDVKLVLQAPNPEATRKIVLDLRRVPKDRQLQGTLLDLPVERSALMGETNAVQGAPLWVPFNFDPIEDSDGATFHLSLRAAYDAPLSDWTPWTSLRARYGAGNPWGDRVHTPPPPPFVFRTMFDELSAIGIAVDGLDAAAGEVSLDLYELPGEDQKAEGVLVRQGLLGHRAPLAAAYALFTFEPLTDARWKFFRLELNLPDNARVIGNDVGVSGLTYHGEGVAPPELIGQTLGEERFTDRDLVFRAFASGYEPAERIEEGSSDFLPRAILAIAAWLLTCAFALRLALEKRVSPDAPE